MQILSFCRFQVFLLLPCSKNKFGIKTTEEHYEQIQNECEDFVLQCRNNLEIRNRNKIRF